LINAKNERFWVMKADAAYGEGVARALGIPMSEVPKNG
jgi:hypothetical protein